jgi:hypothetical protein
MSLTGKGFLRFNQNIPIVWMHVSSHQTADFISVIIRNHRTLEMNPHVAYLVADRNQLQGGSKRRKKQQPAIGAGCCFWEGYMS